MDESKNKPPPTPVNPDNVPSQLKGFDRWVCWSWTWNGNKFDKPPLNARTGRHASSTDPKTWVSFQEAYDRHREGRFDGVGFTLGEAGASGVHFSGLDIDDCVEEGKMRTDAIYLASVINSYTEISPSGSGVKIFTCGPLVGEGRKKDDAKGIEFYDGGRYFTVTGMAVEGFPRDVLYRSVELSDLRRTIFPPPLPGRVNRLSDRELAVSAIASLSPTRAAGYDSWMVVGFALHSVADDLLPEWDNWSRGCPDKYVPGACEKKWRSMKRGGITIGTLLKFAKEDGWVEPEGKPVKIYEPEVSSTANGKDDKHVGHVNGEAKEPRFRHIPPEDITADPLQDLGSDDDPHMGDGLTEADGAGPWQLRIELSNPRRYWLRSPIWKNSLDLRSTNGYILLSKAQLANWSVIRREAMDQAGVYVMPDKAKKPVWDGRGGPRLLRRLMHIAERATAPPDFDKILAAAEWIIDSAKRSGIVTEEKREQMIGSSRNFIALDDGSVIFKLRAVAAASKKESVGFTFEELRDAANRYGDQFWPEARGRRHRYYRFTKIRIDDIENELNRTNRQKTCNAP